MTFDAVQQKILEQLFEQVPINIAVIDRDYSIVSANENFRSKFGEWEERKCYSVYKNRTKPCKKCMAALTFEDGETHVDDELGTDKDGKPARYVLHTAPVCDDDGKVQFVIEMSTDVTEMKQLQRNYHLLFERVPCYMAVMDRDYTIVRANEKFRNTFGDRIGEKCYKVYKKRNEKCENCPAEKTFSDGLEHRAEQVGITQEGERNRYVVHTAPLARTGEEFAHIIEISTDVTEIRTLESELDRLHLFQDSLIKNSIDGIIATDENGDIVIFNPAAEKMFDCKAGDVIGKSATNKFYPSEFVDLIEKKGNQCIIPETELSCGDNETVPVRFSGSVLHKKSDMAGSAAFIQDLTEIKKLEADKLESERMAAVGQTVAGLAHGVKNILTGIQGGMYVMNTGLQNSDAERIFEGWGILERNIEKITLFIRDFLSFTKGEKARMEMVDVRKVSNEIALLFKDTANQKGVVLEVDISDDIEPAPFDNDGLHSCLANLVSNALDACQMSEKEERDVKFLVYEKGGVITFEVADNGVGMDYEIKKKVFSNFFTTKGTKGTGIGLLSTRKIVMQHHGNIAIDSEQEKGSVFKLTFARENLVNLLTKKI